jgi:hypothetical protein
MCKIYIKKIFLSTGQNVVLHIEKLSNEGGLKSLPLWQMHGTGCVQPQEEGGVFLSSTVRKGTR